jgi:hypothetical protein
MKAKRFPHFILFLSVIFVFQSCSKEPGEGGTSSITGKIYVRDWNASFTTLLGEYYAMEQRVYLIYGDDQFYGNDVRTHFDGTYRFDGLKKGTYHVYVYSKDSTQTVASEFITEMRTVEITSNNQHIVLDDIIIID